MSQRYIEDGHDGGGYTRYVLAEVKDAGPLPDHVVADMPDPGGDDTPEDAQARMAREALADAGRKAAAGPSGVCPVCGHVVPLRAPAHGRVIDGMHVPCHGVPR